jgi:hypothetical protein
LPPPLLMPRIVSAEILAGRISKISVTEVSSRYRRGQTCRRHLVDPPWD